MAAATQPHADRAHAVLSASSSSRWMNCPPSARMAEKMPKVDSDYADEGTLAHEISEVMIKYLVKAITNDEMRKEFRVFRTNKHWYDDIVSDCEPYINHVVEQIKLPGAVWFLEQELDLTAFIPEGKGTSDSNVIHEGILYVTDLKFGRGVRVSAVDNDQLKLYGVGALQEYGLLYDIHTVRLAIVQPRIDNTSIWDISVDDLLEWAESEVKPAAEIAFEGKGELKTGDWCKFCKAKLICPTMREEATVLAQQDFSEINERVPAIDGISHEETEEEILMYYKMAGRIREFLDEVEAHVYKRAMGGKKWPGMKLVYGKSRREITDEKGAIQLLLDAGYTEDQITKKSIVGIKALEKLLKDDFDVLADFVHKPQGKPTLVAETDTRTSVSAADDYID